MNIAENKWCLKKAALSRLLDDSSKMEDFKEVLETIRFGDSEGNETTRDILLSSLPLRSALSEKVFYEVVRVKDLTRHEENVLINIWTQDGKYACVYENDRIIRWGAWAVELMQTLPSLMSSLSKQTADCIADSVVASLHTEYEKGGFSVAEMELGMNWDESNGDMAEIYSTDRSGVILDLLE